MAVSGFMTKVIHRDLVSLRFGFFCCCEIITDFNMLYIWNMFSILTTLINQRKIKISDFGLSEMIDYSIRTFVGEIPTYMEPQLFISNEYCLDEKSDV
ncbi:hypothetical protein RhiirB3_405151 [Rhizophagus irregularis]|nr:hypothetical protein RhiirB3_405151 [Rhizophagus irregularis]